MLQTYENPGDKIVLRGFQPTQTTQIVTKVPSF